jgi:hypothetical protein
MKLEKPWLGDMLILFMGFLMRNGSKFLFFSGFA